MSTTTTMRPGLLLLALVLLPSGVARAAAPASRPAFPSRPVLPDGLGCNVHFTDPRPGEMRMIADAGFRLVRMDFAWGGTERKRGEYDFAAYDRLAAACDEHRARLLLILDYSNRLYDDDLSPHTDEGRAAFARWAAAAARHFKGRGVTWEMYNEPNIPQFWRPKPSAEDYAKLALAVGKALREAAPGEPYIGPATSLIDLPYLETCFAAGLLEHWSAVSVHPYRQEPPETVTPEYQKLRALIDKYAPPGKHVPILSGEWGYSAAWKDYADERQGKYLPRQWLVNQLNDVPVSVWYDWHDDGTDPAEGEHHFGAVRHDYHAGRDPVYDPKPAYLAAKALTTALAGYRFDKRLTVGDEKTDYVLQFVRADDPAGRDVRLAVWTTAKEPRVLQVPAGRGVWKVTDHLGKPLADVTPDDKGLAVMVADAPVYLSREK